MDTNEMIALLLPPNGCYKCSDTRKEIAEELARRAAAQPVAWATPSLLVTLSAVEKNHLTNPDRRTRGGEFESAARDAERYSVPLYAAPPAQAEPQEGDLLHTMMEWARTEEGRKQLADSYRPHLWACAKRVADPQNEAATCRHWCGDIEHCQPIASAPAQAEPRTIPAHVQPATLSPHARERPMPDLLTCPHCGYADKDSWECNRGEEGDWEQVCHSCGEKFSASRYVYVAYASRPLTETKGTPDA